MVFSNHQPEVYGFALGSTGRLLYRLKNIDCCYFVFPNNLDTYLDMLIHDQPSYVLWLGSYSGIDQEKIRIETVCSNQFRNDFIEGNKYTEVEIKPFLKPLAGMKFTKAIGNSYCNLVSWKITRLINQKRLLSRYSFLHVPKTMKPWIASQEIDKALQVFKQLPLI